MKNLRRNFERFCYRHQRKGIPNLMLYISLSMLAVYILSMMDDSGQMLRFLMFDRARILNGEVWRLLTFVIVPSGYSPLTLLLSCYLYYFIGKTMESSWGTFRFNLYYFTGVLFTDAAALLLGYPADITQLHLSMMLAYATLFPEGQIYLMYIIPIRLKVLAWIYFGMILLGLLTMPFSYTVFTLIALLNYFLFFGMDIVKVLPSFLQPRRKANTGAYAPNMQTRSKRRTEPVGGKVVQFPYRHKCTVCGRTDQSDPQLEFRYCSKCQGYHCYCIDHINDHAHIG